MKKIIHLLLVITMLITSFNISNKSVYAEEIITGTSTVVNEHYNTNIESKKETISVFSIHPSFSDVTSAANYIREQLVQRNTEFTIDVNSTESDYYILEQKLLDEVFKHTGNPKEGDYLQFHFGGVNTNYSYLPSTSTYTIKFDFVMYTNKQEENAVDKQVEEVIKRLNLNDKSEYEKILAIYDFITSTVAYDYNHLNDFNYNKQYTAYAALIDETSVCQGYANLFYRLALEAGLDARIIGGRSQNQNHAWNIVKLGKEYYNVDSTWDAGLINYQWFMKNQQDFFDHVREERFDNDDFNQRYPMATQSHVDETSSQTLTSNGFEYILSYGKVTITKYKGNDKVVTVPSTIDGYPVLFINPLAFQSNDLEKLIISEGIKKLHQEAIISCNQLKEIYLPASLELVDSYDPNKSVFTGLGQPFMYLNSLEKIYIDKNNKSAVVKDGAVYSYDMSVFYYLPPKSGVKVLNLPDGVKEIASDACNGNLEIEKVIMPDTVEIINYWAFCNAQNLKEMNISKNCRLIGQYALQNTKLKNLYIPNTMKDIVGPAINIPTLENITVEEGGMYHLENGVLCCGNAIIAYPAMKKDTTYTVPSHITNIAWGAFEYAKNIKSVTIHGNINTISYSSFFRCENLEEVIINPGVEKIDDSAFFDCWNLKTIIIPSTVSKIGEHAFANIDDLTITCEKGSYAEQYAKENGRPVKYYTPEFPFLDVSNNKWYYNTIKETYKQELMTGTSNTKFEPEGTMTRGMVVTVLNRIAGKPSVEYKGMFSDVPSKKYCANAVEWAAQNKVVSGYKNGTFGADDNITRQDVAVILHNYAKAIGLDLTKTKDLNTFKDYKNVSSYASNALEWATANGILSGTKDGNLNPKGNATRAECAKMLLQFSKLVEANK